MTLSGSANPYVRNGFSQQKTKHNNTMLIFNLIRRFGPVSRIKLAKSTGLSATTVSMLVEELIESGFVSEIGCEDTTTSGRKPISLQINGPGAYECVIEVINTGLNFYLYNLACELVDIYRYRIKNSGSHIAADVITRMLVKNDIEPDRLLGINIDYPGIVDSRNARLVYSAVVSSSSYFDNKDIISLSERFPSSVIEVSNDSTVAAYTEFLFGEEHADKKVLYLNMFECIGAGCIIVNGNGEKVSDFSVEFGHIMVDSNGKKCKCGNTGCLEQVASTCEIIKRINDETDLELTYSSEFRSEINVGCMKYLGKELENGNEKVRLVLEDIASKIAIALASVINIIDPSDIFIGGQIAFLGDIFIDMIRNNIDRLTVLPSPSKRLIHKSGIDIKACSVGAANMIIDNAFSIIN